MKAWYFLRSVLFSAGQISSMVVMSLLGQLTRPLPVAQRYDFMKYWARFCIWWLKVTCGLHYRVHGAEYIQHHKAGLILARHESAWETLAFQEIFPRQAYVLKRELLKIPFFGWGMALLNPIAIDRGAGRKALNQLVKEGGARLADGDWVVVFPEGTRMPPDQLGKINVGGAMLASKTDALVYLVAHNAGDFWPKNSFIKQPGMVEVFISEPIDVTGMSVAQINQLTENWINRYAIQERPEKSS